MLIRNFMKLDGLTKAPRIFKRRAQINKQDVNKIKRYYSKVRNWIRLEDETNNNKNFRIMSYNLLAPVYGKKEYFPFTSENDINWTTRQDKIIE